MTLVIGLQYRVLTFFIIILNLIGQNILKGNWAKQAWLDTQADLSLIGTSIIGIGP